MKTDKGSTRLAVILTTALLSSGLARGQSVQQDFPRSNSQLVAVPHDGGSASGMSYRTAGPASVDPTAAKMMGDRGTVRPNVRRGVPRAPARRGADQTATERTDTPTLPEHNNSPSAADRNPSSSAASLDAPGAADVNAVPAASIINPAVLIPQGSSVPIAPNSSTRPVATSDGALAKTTVPQQVDHSETGPTSPDFPFIKAAGGLGLVLSLIALGYFGARRFFPQYFVRKTSEKSLKLIETLSIGEKRSLAVIQFDSQRFIVGNTPNQITLLASLPSRLSIAGEPQTATIPPFELSRAKGASDTFRNLYEVEKTNGKGARKPIPPDIRAKMRQLRESLEQ